MMAKYLTVNMEAALALAEKSGGELYRHEGGFWAARDCRFPNNDGVPDHWFSTGTIRGLVSRGRVEYSEFNERRRDRMPIAVRVIKPEGKS